MRTGQHSGVSERSSPEWESDPLGGPSHPIAPSAPAAPPVLAGLRPGLATSRARASGGAGNADLPAAGRRFQRSIFSPDPDSRPYLQRHYDCFAVPTAEADMESPESSGTPHPAAQPMSQRSIFSPDRDSRPYLERHYDCFAAPTAEADMVPPESSGTLPPVAGPLSRRMSEDGYELDTAARNDAPSEALSRPSGQFGDGQVRSTNSFSRRDPTSSGSMRPPHTSSAPVISAAHQLALLGIRWQEDQNQWLVRIKGPGDSKPQSESFPISRYGNDVARARRAAVKYATDIRFGIFILRPRLRASAIYQSTVPSVRWNVNHNRWPVDDSARQAAEQCAADI